ncbi:antibiotic biosynthesis monooxygenase [Nocardioides hwasunensis]|uniref:Antibiotic biosynthesis monooxygenase n=1 Tax=Nocardioides hwasunensis TaxID=397258 RepID=A0ABR8MDH4_9ACTN|nr:antibiotic biosynthesis monooxygenase [Nocardioides hwasunensis]MBD3913585.1 antibiotic biosynthesis monooxygenase [Nocardioides hwasunensis]
MTIHVLGEVPIGDLDQFLAVFSTDGLAKRQEHGCSGATVLSPIHESGRVVVILEFADEQSFQAFRDDATAPPIMRRGGAQGPPTFTVLQQVGSYPH